MKQVCLSCALELPEDILDAANILSMIRSPWQVLLKELDAKDAKYVAKCEIVDTRSKVPAVPGGAKRGRKPRERLPTIDRHHRPAEFARTMCMAERINTEGLVR